jgi:hypothetical protein
MILKHFHYDLSSIHVVSFFARKKSLMLDFTIKGASWRIDAITGRTFTCKQLALWPIQAAQVIASLKNWTK